MTAPLFIGDEVTAAGFRLAGVRIRTPKPEDLMQVISWASDNTSLIMITPEYLAFISTEARAKLLSQVTPPTVVIPDINANYPVEDLARQLKTQLGVFDESTDETIEEGHEQATNPAWNEIKDIQ